jgi:hypothetical protein
MMDGREFVGIITERHCARNVVVWGRTSPATQVGHRVNWGSAESRSTCTSRAVELVHYQKEHAAFTLAVGAQRRGSANSEMGHYLS